MDTFENQSRGERLYERAQDEARGIKRRLGEFGRRVKHIDMRGQIDAHPFTAIGIAAGVGALIGLVRPMPERSRISGALMGAFTALAFRLVREAALMQLGNYARGLLVPDEEPGMEANVPQSGL